MAFLDREHYRKTKFLDVAHH